MSAVRLISREASQTTLPRLLLRHARNRTQILQRELEIVAPTAKKIIGFHSIMGTLKVLVGGEFLRRGFASETMVNPSLIVGHITTVFGLLNAYQAIAWRHISGTLRYMNTGVHKGLMAPSSIARHYREVALPRLAKEQKILDIGLASAGGVGGNGAAGLLAHHQGWDEGTTLAARVGGTVTGAVGGFSASKLIGNIRLNLLQYRTLENLSKKFFG